MSKKDSTPRRYDSAHRQQQARRTRQSITEAARRLFIENGYAGATIGAIAQEAGVATETIYATFGNKRAILSHVVNVAVGGDDQPVPLLERSFVHATEQETDQRQQIHMFAEQLCAIMQRMGPIFDVIRTAAKTEPDIAELRSSILQTRRQGMNHFVQALMAHGPLRPGLSLSAAADNAFALSSGEMFTLLTIDLSWSNEQYITWLAETLIATLLP